MLAKTTFDGRTTVVEVSADEESLTFPEGITGVGSALCRKSDVFDPKTGEGIALGRAIEDFGRQVAAKWDARVITYEQLEKVTALFIRQAFS